MAKAGLAVMFIILLFYSYVESNKQVLLKTNVDPSKPVFSPTKLKQYDGSDVEKPIYMAIKGVVFDVSQGKDFYGKGAPYNALVGIDSTQAVARMSLEPEHLNHRMDTLSESDLEQLERVFEGTYIAKYPVVGYMDYLVELHAAHKSEL